MNQRSTLIVAEAGVNHNGDLKIARSLIEAAADAGADLIKFQTFTADRLVAKQAPLAAYQLSTGESDHFEMLRRLELSRADHEHLIEICRLNGIGFFSTGFDLESVDLLVELGQTRFKVPSGEINNLPLLRHIGSLGREVILSTGMANLTEVATALQVLESSGTPRELTTVLHCTTDYPASIGDVNLRAMTTIARELNVSVGYSDHTLGTEVSVAAVAMGATVIEKHFTLDRSYSGPDHSASLEPTELAAMVSQIRNIEAALGDGIKKPTVSEKEHILIIRKSIVASRAVIAGELLDDSTLTVKRPGTGLSPIFWDEVYGTRAKRDFLEDEQIEL